MKSGASACPFCDVALAPPGAPAALPDTRGWKRAALFSFGLAVANCGSTTTSTSGDATPDTTADTAADTAAAAPQDTAVDRPAEVGADVQRDVPEDDNGGVAPPYGIPPEDAGVPDDNGSMKSDYGAPPPPDASADS